MALPVQMMEHWYGALGDLEDIRESLRRDPPLWSDIHLRRVFDLFGALVTVGHVLEQFSVRNFGFGPFLARRVR